MRYGSRLIIICWILFYAFGRKLNRTKKKNEKKTKYAHLKQDWKAKCNQMPEHCLNTEEYALKCRLIAWFSHNDNFSRFWFFMWNWKAKKKQNITNCCWKIVCLLAIPKKNQLQQWAHTDTEQQSTTYISKIYTKINAHTQRYKHNHTFKQLRCIILGSFWIFGFIFPINLQTFWHSG